MPDPTLAIVGGAVTFDALAGADQAGSRAGLEVQRAELIHADDLSIRRQMLVQTPDGPVFGPEFGGY